MIIVLNNKSNLSKDEFLDYQEQLKDISSIHNLVLCPTLLNINLFNLNNFNLGAQNVSCYDDGQYTGEVSARDLYDSNVRYTIVGHSERRKYQKETNEEINKKIKKLIENDIKPILCIGETKEERDSNKVEEVIKTEILEATKNIAKEDVEKIIIAYEPIWSIGTGVIPTIEEIDNVNNMIKSILPRNIILYGGSANEKNVDILNESSTIAGFLLGGLSLKPEEFKIFIEKLKSVN